MRILTAVIAIVIVGAGLSCPLWSQRTDHPAADNKTSASNESEDFEISLARAHLELAKLDLRRALEVNRQIPDVLPATLIENLRLHVVIDQEQLKHYLNGEHADSHQMCIRRAEAKVKIAEADVKRTYSVHQRMQTTTSQLDHERSLLVAKMAKLNLMRTQEPKHSESTLTHLQWQIDDLRHHVLELQMEMAAKR